MSKPKVLLTRRDIPEHAFEILKEKYDLEVGPLGQPISRDELLQKIAGKDYLFCLLTDRIDKDVIEAGVPTLKAIVTMSVGFEHIDIEECKKHGIKVGNTAGVSSAPNAELTVTLTLAVTRRLFEANREVTNGGWIKSDWGPLYMCGPGLEDATIGIIGLGNIGIAVAKRLRAFEVSRILYTDIAEKPEAAQVQAEFSTLDDILRQADVVIVNCVLNDKTRGMINREAFAKMKKTAYLINTARGGIVDHDALLEALKTGQIAGAGIDVCVPEPLPIDHELTKLNNLVILPHIGSAQIKARISMADTTLENLAAAVEGKPMKSPVC